MELEGAVYTGEKKLRLNADARHTALVCINGTRDTNAPIPTTTTTTTPAVTFNTVSAIDGVG